MNQLLHKTWIVVAHRAGAIFYESRGPALPLSRALLVENPLGRARSGEIETDRPGRAFDRKGGGRHAMSKEESSTEHVEHEFVQRLLAQLESSHATGAFDRLVLIAPPKMLGRLRQGLAAPLRALLVADMAKDLAMATADDVRRQLEPLIQV